MQYIVDKPLFIRVTGIWLTLLCCCLMFAAYFQLIATSRISLEWLTTLNFVGLTAILALTLPKGIWSISFIFFFTFSVFHGGLVLANSVNGITDEDIHYQISFWFYEATTDNAIHLINIAMFGLSLAALIFSRRGHEKNTEQVDARIPYRIFHLGGALLCVMIVCFFGTAVLTGAATSYGAYLDVLSANPLLGSIFAYLYLFIGLAIVFVSASYKSGYTRLYFVLFALWALFAFKLGLRGEVMFPGTVAACMFGRKGAPVKTHTLLIIVLGFLTASAIVKSARVSGDYSSVATANPMNAVAEMGSSLRAIHEVIDWRVTGDELLFGASYWAPFERQLAHVIPGLQRLPATQDKRLLNVVVQERVGPIGFSPVAEAYLNFGEKGVLIMMFLLGLVLAWLDNKRSHFRNDLLIGVSLVPLFIMIRNSFTHVPVQIVLGIVIAVAFMYLAKSGIGKHVWK